MPKPDAPHWRLMFIQQGQIQNNHVLFMEYAYIVTNN